MTTALSVVPRGAGIIAALTAVETPQANATPKKSPFIVILPFPCIKAPNKFATYHSPGAFVDALELG